MQHDASIDPYSNPALVFERPRTVFELQILVYSHQATSTFLSIT